MKPTTMKIMTFVMASIFVLSFLIIGCEEMSGEAFRTMTKRCTCEPYDQNSCEGQVLVTSSRDKCCKISTSRETCDVACVGGVCVSQFEYDELLEASRPEYFVDHSVCAEGFICSPDPILCTQEMSVETGDSCIIDEIPGVCQRCVGGVSVEDDVPAGDVPEGIVTGVGDIPVADMGDIPIPDFPDESDIGTAGDLNEPIVGISTR